MSNDTSRKGCVCFGNDHACDIVGARNVHFAFPNGFTFGLENVYHVSKCHKEINFHMIAG